MADATYNLGKRKASLPDLNQIPALDLTTIPLKKRKIGGNVKESSRADPEVDTQSTGQKIQLGSGAQHSDVSDNETRESNYRDEEYKDNGSDEFEDEDEYDEDGYDEDEEDHEYEVEELEHTFSDGIEHLVKLKLYISKEEGFETWLDNIIISCTYNGNSIGHGLGRYIRREQIRANFWRDMEEPSQDMSNLAFEIFDSYGYVKNNLKEHCVQRGTGVWGSELDFGPLFLLERIEVTGREWRRMGLGKAMVNALIQKAQKRMKPRNSNRLEEAMFLAMFGSIGDPERLPLHYATVTLSDTDCVEFYKTFEPKDRAEWKQVDRSHDTVLHVAASRLKPHSTNWLIENVDSGKSLSLARNLKGYIPLEALQDQLETRRTQLEFGAMTMNISDKFRGYPPEATACLSALLHRSPYQSLSDIQGLRLKYGCTCGECLEGFLSPRMKLALLYQAEITNDRLQVDIDDGPTWCERYEDFITHVGLDIQRNFRTNKSLRQGFVNVFAHAATCLQSNTVPRRENVLESFQNDDSEWPPVTRNYLERGGATEGKIEVALKIIFHSAEDEDERAGNGEFERVMETDLAHLKVCRNDHEFGFVALSCGLPERNS